MAIAIVFFFALAVSVLVPFAATANEVTQELVACGWVVGVVVDDETGAPVEGATVLARPSAVHLGLVQGFAETTTNETGQYRLALAAGGWSVRVVHPDYETQAESVNVECPEVETGQDFRLTPVNPSRGSIMVFVNEEIGGQSFPIEDNGQVVLSVGACGDPATDAIPEEADQAESVEDGEASFSDLLLDQDYCAEYTGTIYDSNGTTVQVTSEAPHVTVDLFTERIKVALKISVVDSSVGQPAVDVLVDVSHPHFCTGATCQLETNNQGTREFSLPWSNEIYTITVADGNVSFQQPVFRDLNLRQSKAGGNVTESFELVRSLGDLKGAVESDGSPVVGAEVCLKRQASLERFTCTFSDADGEYHMRTTWDTYNMTIDHTDYLPQAENGVEVNPLGETVQNFTLTQGGRGFVAGEVCDGDTGSCAWPGGQPVVHVINGSTEVANTTVGNDGSFNVSVLEGTGMDVEVSFANYQTQVQSNVEVVEDETTDIGPIDIDRNRYRLDVEVLDEAGDPVDESTVTVQGMSPLNEAPECATGTNGQCSLGELPFGDYEITAMIMDGGVLYETQANVTLVDQPLLETLVLDTPPARTITGIATDADHQQPGMPLEGVTVQTDQTDIGDDPRYVLVSTTDENGTYELTVPSTRDVTVTATIHGYSPDSTTFTAAETNETHPFDLSRLHGTVNGTIQEQHTGDVLEDVKVNLTGQETGARHSLASDGNGFFQFDDLPWDTYDLNATADLYLTSQMTVNMTPDTLNIGLGNLDMVALGSVQGTVRDIDVDNVNDEPIEDANVQLVGNNTGHIATGTSNGAGEFEVEGLPADNYTMQVIADDYQTNTTLIIVDHGPVTDLGDVDLLRETGTLTGKIEETLSEGNENITLKAVEFRCNGDVTGDQVNTVNLSKGDYTLRLPWDDYACHVEDPKENPEFYSSSQIEIGDLQADDTKTENFEMERRLWTIKGRVTDAVTEDHVSMPQICVETIVMGSTEPSLDCNHNTDPSGFFSIDVVYHQVDEVEVQGQVLHGLRANTILLAAAGNNNYLPGANATMIGPDSGQGGETVTVDIHVVPANAEPNQDAQCEPEDLTGEDVICSATVGMNDNTLATWNLACDLENREPGGNVTCMIYFNLNGQEVGHTEELDIPLVEQDCGETDTEGMNGTVVCKVTFTVGDESPIDEEHEVVWDARCDPENPEDLTGEDLMCAATLSIDETEEINSSWEIGCDLANPEPGGNVTCMIHINLNGEEHNRTVELDIPMVEQDSSCEEPNTEDMNGTVACKATFTVEDERHEIGWNAQCDPEDLIGEGLTCSATVSIDETEEINSSWEIGCDLANPEPGGNVTCMIHINLNGEEHNRTVELDIPLIEQDSSCEEPNTEGTNGTLECKATLTVDDESPIDEQREFKWDVGCEPVVGDEIGAMCPTTLEMDGEDLVTFDVNSVCSPGDVGLGDEIITCRIQIQNGDDTISVDETKNVTIPENPVMAATINGTVTDGDAKEDDPIPDGIPGAVVTATPPEESECGGVEYTTVTDALGSYILLVQCQGNYDVKVEHPLYDPAGRQVAIEPTDIQSVLDGSGSSMEDFMLARLANTATVKVYNNELDPQTGVQVDLVGLDVDRLFTNITGDVLPETFAIAGFHDIPWGTYEVLIEDQESVMSVLSVYPRITDDDPVNPSTYAITITTD